MICHGVTLFQRYVKEAAKCLLVEVCADDAKAADDGGRALAYVGLTRYVIKVEPRTALAGNNTLGAQYCAVLFLVGKGSKCLGQRLLVEALGSFRTVADKYLVGVVMVMVAVLMVVVAAALALVMVMLVFVVVVAALALVVVMLVLVVVMLVLVAVMAALTLVMVMLVLMLVVVMAALALMVVMMLVMVRMAANGAGFGILQCLKLGLKGVGARNGCQQLCSAKLLPIGGHNNGSLVVCAQRRYGIVDLLLVKPLGVA